MSRGSAPLLTDFGFCYHPLSSCPTLGCLVCALSLAGKMSQHLLGSLNAVEWLGTSVYRVSWGCWEPYIIHLCVLNAQRATWPMEEPHTLIIEFISDG